MDKVQIMLSYRMSHTGPETRQLVDALNAYSPNNDGHTVMTAKIVNTRGGDDILHEVVETLNSAHMYVVMGDETYGEQTGGQFDTYKEMNYITEGGSRCLKPWFLVKMCDNFKHEATSFLFGSNINYASWTPGDPMPDSLPSMIYEKYLTWKESQQIAQGAVEPPEDAWKLVAYSSAGAKWDDDVKNMEALVPLDGHDDSKYAEFLREGFLTLAPKGPEAQRKLRDDIRGHHLEDNAICSSLAVTAASTYMFFGQFSKYCDSLVRMPKESQREEQKKMLDEVCEAYKSAFEYSLNLAKAMQKIGGMADYLENTSKLVRTRMKALKGRPLAADRVAESTHKDDIIEALMVLDKGASEQIQRAMAILNSAMEQAATGKLWEQLLKDEQDARELMDTADKRLGELIRSVELNKLTRRHAHLDSLLAENRTKVGEKEDNLRKMKSAHEAFVQAFNDNQQEAFRTAERNWETQKAQAISSAQAHVTKSEELVQKGGHKVGTKTTQSGWWLWASKKSEDIYDVESAKGALASAQEHLRKVNEQYQECNRPKMGEDLGQRAERSFAHEEDELAKLAKERETLQTEKDECGSKADEIRECQRQATEEFTRTTEAWEESKKKLGEALELDEGEELSAGVTSLMIKSYRAGLEMQKAMALAGFLQKQALFNLSDFGMVLEQQCAMIMEGETADEQLELINCVQEELILVPEAEGPRQLTTDASIAIVFCKHVAKLFVPLPSFEEMSKGDVLAGYDMALQIKDAAAAAESA